MSTSFAFKPIVTDGLVFCLDAGNPKSLDPGTLLNGLVSYWNLDGNSTDYTGSNNGTDTDVSYIDGKIGKGAYFNGSTGRIQVDDSTDFTLGSSDFCFSMWVKRSVLGTRQTFFGQTDNNGNDANTSIWGEFTSSDWVLFLIIDSINTNLYYSVSCPINDTNFHFLTIVRTGNLMELYVDNVVQGSVNVTGVIVNNSNQKMGFGIGGNINSGYNVNLTGMMDEIGFWNRSLSPSEITTLYNLTNSLNKWKDLSSNGNDGILTKGPTFSSSSSGSIVFDGVNDYVDLGSVVNSYLVYGSPFSMEIFCYLIPNGTDQAIISNTWDNPGTHVRLTSGNAIRFISTNGNAFGGAYTGWDSPVITEGWYNIVATYNGSSFISSNINLYLNGHLSNDNLITTVQAVVNITSPNNLNLGRSSNSASYAYMNGKISLTRIYNKSLTPTEVLQNYNALKSRFI